MSELREDILQFDDTHVCAYLVKFVNGPIKLLPIAIGDAGTCEDASLSAPRMMVHDDPESIEFCAIVVGEYEQVFESGTFGIEDNLDYNVVYIDRVSHK